ncbi:MAG TPA: hypothetical protein VJY41_06500 [Prolixibacteraceae bacterium]|nr:hypothetical protein [Prolixibacteraceae bacterium]
MKYFNSIITIAKYERKILFRSWFFRIFAILSLIIIGIYSGVTIFDKNPFTWMFRSLPSSLIYSNMFLLNIFQSVIAIFLATDFMKRDKKLNTSEVLYIRPMSNLEYIVGKTLGLLSVFIILNLLVIVLTSVYLFVSSQVVFRILPILYYFILISIPALIFVIGISYALMSLIKNQPLSLIILLGYVALVLFYLGDKMGYLFDYMAFQMPMLYSDIIGFSNIEQLLFQRLSYFMLGITLIVFSTWRLNRLPNTKNANSFLAVSSLLLAVISLYGFFSIVRGNNNIQKNRKEWVQLSADNYQNKVPDLVSANIYFEYAEKAKVTAKLNLQNNTNVALDTLLLSLNPGFKVDKIESSGLAIPFLQQSMLIRVFPEKALNVNENIELTISYAGIPDMNIAYLDNKDEDVYGFDQAMTLRIDRRYGFYSRNYVLLTKEVLWYPVPGVFYDPTRPAIFRQHFTRFDLTVKSEPGMIPVSQGICETADSIEYHFAIRDKLPQLSLNIGRFKQQKIDIDGIDVSISYIEGHNYFTKNFDQLSDTIVDLIIEYLDDYERPLGLFYPYSSFNLVEAPAQYAFLPHSWTSTLANAQPQVINFPEWGFNVQQADFASSARRIKRDSERNKEGLAEKEIQSRMFASFLRSTFSASESNMRFGPQTASAGNPFHIFPNYYYFVNYITSSECPVLNYAFESYLMKGADNPRQMFMTRMTGIGDEEEANLMLKEKSLKQIIAEESDRQKVNKVLRAKGAYLLNWMEKQVGDVGFNNFLLEYLYNNSFREIKYEELTGVLSGKFDMDMGNFLSDWYNANRLPAFGFDALTVFETIEKSQAVFVVRTKVTNYSNVDGLVKYTFMLGEGGRGGRSQMGGGFSDSDTDERIFLIEGGKTKELQMVLKGSPRSVIQNSLLAENIPSSSMVYGLRSEKNEKIEALNYEKESNQAVTLDEAGVLIVDNRDPGFLYTDPAMNNPIRQFVEKRKKQADSEFVGEGFGSAPSTWSLVPNADYYGRIEHSAMVVRSGDGSKTASWTQELPAYGYYDIYVYLNQQRRFGRGQRNSEPAGQYIYKVMHDDGNDEIILEVKNFENGWNLLGSFYISTDSSTVVLSDAGGAGRVVADAVKWVFQR